jgi:hypothetical protein
MGNYDTFDHKLFKKSPREMNSTYPQHWVILELAYQAVKHSLAILAFRARLLKRISWCYIEIANVEHDRNIGCYPAKV